MDQSSNLFVNVINNISVTTTIVYSVIIIACSVEIPLIINKVVLFLMNRYRARNKAYENDYHTYQDILTELNLKHQDYDMGEAEAMEFLRLGGIRDPIPSVFIDRLLELDNMEFQRPKYQFKNHQLEKAKKILFSELHHFIENYGEFFQECGKNNLDAKLVSQIEKDGKKVYLDIHGFALSVKKFLDAYDNFVVCGNNVFNFEITTKPAERF